MNYSESFNSSDPELYPDPAYSDHTQKWHWLLDMSDIEPGKSAVLGDNEIFFYGIHGSGLIIILLSVISSVLVIFSICKDSKKKKEKKWDFSERFPLYLAISDGLWGISNLSADHVVLVIQKVFPEKRIAAALAMNVSFFFGYQQLMSAGLSFYAYLKIVRHVPLDLGWLEWKLHAFVLTFMASNMCLYWSLNAYGNAGFWFLADLKTDWGKVFGANICVTCTIHALCTLVAYRSIQNVINNQKRVVAMHNDQNSTLPSQDNSKSETPATLKKLKDNGSKKAYHSTANNCLTTFVLISLCLYCPLAVFAWIFVILGFFGYLEPITSWGIVIAANSGGWVNAWGYFHNKKLKQNKRQAIQNITTSAVCSTSSTSNI